MFLQPVELAPHPEIGNPRDLLRHLGDLVTQLIHRDEPLIHQPEDKLRVATPADGISVSDLVEPIERALIAEAAIDRPGHLEHAQPAQLAESVNEFAEFVQRRDSRKIVHLAESIVFLAGSRGGVNEARTVARADLVPQDHSVLDTLLGRNLVERPVIAEAFQLPALDLLDDLVVDLQRLQSALDQVERFVPAVRPRAADPDLDICQVGMDGHSHIRGERPRRRRPDEECLAGPVD